MNLKRFTIALLLTMVLGSFLQAQVRNCGTMEYLEYQQQQEPNRSLKMMEIERHTNDYLEGHERVDGVITIPVVVHVVWNTAAENISDAQIQSQIDILNEDFRRLNTDASNTPADFQGIAADSEIEFCLATVDPNGASTNGITRTQTSVTAFSTNDAVKFNSSGGKDAWPASDYLNIWVCDISGGILGYAQFPGGSAATDGVVNDYQYFGNIGTATAPFDLGRTCTHEIGHWLNLRHIWGDGNCSVDDFVNDTPTADGPNYTGGACTYPGPNSCNDGAGDLPDMFQNYMDYSDDGCMNLFTLGQKARMRALFNTGGARESLLNSDACGMATPPTCEDGIQNGDETGVDCGGTNCPPCPCNAGPLTLTITFDTYPGETSWDVTDIGGAVVASGGTYGSESAGSTIMVPVNLPDGDYTFTIYDSFGDGICCTYGNGSYSLVDNDGTTIVSGGDFDGSEATSFCVTNPVPTCDDGIQNGDETGVDCGGTNCPPCPCNAGPLTLTITFDTYPGETSWDVTDIGGAVVASGGTYGSESAGSTIMVPVNLPDGDYTFTIYDSFGDGICCTYGNGSYSLVDNNGTTIASGGDFDGSEATSFCVISPDPVSGCTDPNAHNYNPLATVDDGSCETCSDGIQNGDETGVDCGGALCPTCPVPGCTDPGAHNYDPTATVDDGSCETCSDGIQNGDETGVDCGGALCPTCPVPGCTDPGAHNYDPTATVDDGSCETCADGLQNGDETGVDCGGVLCEPCNTTVPGCTDPGAHNYDPTATVDDGSCETCADGLQNGDETGVDCGGVLCEPCNTTVPGCTDPGAHNYDPTATVDDGSCETCADGIQNGDETGVDCGGVLCEACALPDGWTTEEEGINCGTLTNADYSAGTFSLSAEDCSVPGYYSTTDGQAFISQELCGDGELIAHVSSISGNAWAGIAFRESNDPGAKMLQIAVSNSGLASRRIRVTTGGIAFNHTFLNQNQFWLKLTRMGNQFGAYMSSDGINWSVVILTYIPMSNCIQTGMFVSNMTPGSMATADFDQVQLNGGMAYSSGSRQGADLTDLKRDFVVYPNPTSGLLNIALDAYMDQALEVKVYNQVGQIVLTQIFQDRHASVETLQFGQLESGLYLIQLHADDKVATQKVNVIR